MKRKIFVTTGSAFPFDSLIKFLDQRVSIENFEFIFQIGKGRYIPRRHDYFVYVENIDGFFRQADLIICHAGAGTIFHLLENDLPFIAVPNFDRKDPHQKDICEFLIENNLGCVCYSFENLLDSIKRYDQNRFDKYVNDNSKIIKFLLKQI